MLNLKKCLFFVFVFFQLNSFAMLDDNLLEAPYDEIALERLKAFSRGERPEVNHFANENLKGIKLENTVVKNGIFNNNRFDYSHFIKFSFKDGSKFLNSNLKDTRFKDTFFYDSDIKSSKFSETKVWGSIFKNFVIFDSDFSNSVFLNCRFANMIIDSKDGKKCFISENNFKSSFFKSCTFRSVGFNNNNFKEVGIENCSFKDCFISGINFSRASFKDVIFENCVFVDCKSLDEICFTSNVVFNFCEFVKTDDKDGYSEELIETMENLGANVMKKPGKWEEFKVFAGAFLKITSHVGVSFLTAGISEYARSVISDCNRACAVWLNQTEQTLNDTNTTTVLA
jgi:uncharacterized protein YjbI with pentapeptide repeats